MITVVKNYGQLVVLTGIHKNEWICECCESRVFGCNTKCPKCKYAKSNSTEIPDWICSSCKRIVYGSRSDCIKCGTAKGNASIASLNDKVESPYLLNAWICKCEIYYSRMVSTCKWCEYKRPLSMQQSQQVVRKTMENVTPNARQSGTSNSRGRNSSMRRPRNAANDRRYREDVADRRYREDVAYFQSLFRQPTTALKPPSDTSWSEN